MVQKFRSGIDRMIRTSLFISSFIAVCSSASLSSCGEKQPARQQPYVHAGWNTLGIGDWTIQAPDGFVVEFKPGTVSEPGNLVSEKHGIEIHFDMWNEPDANHEDCDEDMLIENIDLTLASSEEFYAADIEHSVWLDTINGRYAVLTRPLKTGNGTVSVHFNECHRSLAMSVQHLTKEQEELVLEMFRTIDRKQDGKQH
jgi:hypothetical protein